ncbi:MAG: glycosyltransferase family 4 protein [Chloroflexi bacterium]|nr:glycosyltransferase family 4 protein [Chloroflexota bacterium]
MRNGLKNKAPGNQDFDLAVIHITFEGIQTFGGGVASVTRGHLGAMPRLQEELGKSGIKLTPYFLEIAYAKNHERRDPAFQKKAEEEVKKLGGKIEYLVNFSEGYLPKAPWGVGDLGAMDNWKTASAAGAAIALNIAQHHDLSVIYCHDSLFALAPIYITLQDDAFGARVVAIYVMHSTALTHEMPLPNPDRIMVECAGVQWAKVKPDCKLGYISEFMSEHVARDYGARPEDMVPTGNGINPSDPYFRLRPRDHIIGKLKEYNIPIDKPLVFSWGRAVEYKRYDVLLEAAAKLKGKAHPVIMVTPRWEKLVDLSQALGLDTTFVFAFDPELVACLLQWENTIAAASLAYREPFGLTPIEIRMHARKSGPMCVVSDTGGLAEQVHDGVDGFVTRQDDPADVARVISHMLSMSQEAKDAIRRAGLSTVLHNYTWASQILKTLSSVVPEVAAIEAKARDELVHETLVSIR